MKKSKRAFLISLLAASCVLFAPINALARETEIKVDEEIEPRIAVATVATETKAEVMEFINPVENGVVTVDYNVDKGLKCIHIRGTDVTDNSLDVLAAADGEVVAVVESANGLFGVLVDHGNGYQTKYGGLESVNFAENDVVNQGDIIGETDTNSMSFVIIHDGERLVNTKELIGIV